jgi:hypothetical protein
MRTHLAKLIVAFRNSAKRPQKYVIVKIHFLGNEKPSFYYGVTVISERNVWVGTRHKTLRNASIAYEV